MNQKVTRDAAENIGKEVLLEIVGDNEIYNRKNIEQVARMQKRENALYSF
jgi:hypothetical protein